MNTFSKLDFLGSKLDQWWARDQKIWSDWYSCAIHYIKFGSILPNCLVPRPSEIQFWTKKIHFWKSINFAIFNDLQCTAIVMVPWEVLSQYWNKSRFDEFQWRISRNLHKIIQTILFEKMDFFRAKLDHWLARDQIIWHELAFLSNSLHKLRPDLTKLFGLLPIRDPIMLRKNPFFKNVPFEQFWIIRSSGHAVSVPWDRHVATRRDLLNFRSCHHLMEKGIEQSAFSY